MIVEHALKIASHCGKGLGMQGRSAWEKNQWSSMVSRAASGSTSCKMAGPTGPRDVTHELGAVCYVIIQVARAFGPRVTAGPQKWRRLQWTRVRPQKHISRPEPAMSR